jgi:hypothetical protein
MAPGVEKARQVVENGVVHTYVIVWLEQGFLNGDVSVV